MFTKARGRDVIFWQSARTTRQARPNVAVPTARAAGRQFEILVDSHERYPWTFSHQQATTERRALPAGDYAVELDGAIVAAVERKSLADLVSTMTSGKLRYVLADLAAVPDAAVVVEDRYSAVFKLDHVRPAVVAEGLGEAAARFPAVPIVFAETRPLAQEWTYRFLGAALAHHHDDRDATPLAADLPPAGEVPPPEPTTAEVRAWARREGLEVSDRGRLPPEIWTAFRDANPWRRRRYGPIVMAESDTYLDRGERDRMIVAAHRAGRSMPDIAAEVGLSAERVRQVVRRADGGRPSRRGGGAGGGRAGPLAHRQPGQGRVGDRAGVPGPEGRAERVRLERRRRLRRGRPDRQADQDPAAAAGARAAIAVDDSGRGMDPDRLRDVARNLFESSKAGDDRTLGEKAIGLLAFQQLGGCCEIVSRAVGQRRDVDASTPPWRRIGRAGPRAASGQGDERDDRVHLRARHRSGRVLTQRKVVEYMRRRRGAAIAAGAYELEVVEGRTGELVTPDEPAGLPIPLAGHDTLWGKLDFALYVAGDADPGRHVAVVGRAGTTIIDDLTDLEEFDHEPWTSGHLSGRVSFEPLRQSAGRRAILRDDEIYPVFRDAVRSVEPVLTRAIERIRRDLDVATAERLGDALRQVFGRVLRELADLENPMRTLVGDEPGAGADGIAPPAPRPDADEPPEQQPSIEDLDRSTVARHAAGAADPSGRRPRSTTASAVDRARPHAQSPPQPLRRRLGHRALQRATRRLPPRQGRRDRPPRLPRHPRRQGVRRLQQPPRRHRRPRRGARPHADPRPPPPPPPTPTTSVTHPASVGAVDSDLERFADLPHPVVAETTEALHQDTDGHALD